MSNHQVTVCGIDNPHIFFEKFSMQCLILLMKDESSFVIFISNSSKLWYTIVNSPQEHVLTKN